MSGVLSPVAPRPLWRPLSEVGLVVLTAAFVIGLQPLASSQNGTALEGALHSVSAAVYVVTGIVVLRRRPHNRTGVLLVGAGLAFFVPDLQVVPVPLVAAVAALFANIAYAIVAHLGLAFPSGRVQHPVLAGVVALTYAWVVLGALGPLLFGHPAGVSAFTVDANPAAERATLWLEQAGNLVVVAVVVGAALLRRHAAAPPARRAMAPVIWASAPFVFVVVSLNFGLAWLPGWFQSWVPTLVPLALATLPIAVLAGLLRSRLASLAVGHLVVELTADPRPEQLHLALANALGDPNLRIAYNIDPDGWVDEQGHPLALPDTDTTTHTLLERHGRTIAALIHDRALRDDTTLVTEVAAAVALAIENERLRIELESQLAAVRESRARLVEVADQERRRIERDLHDGAQQQLLALMLALGRVRHSTEDETSAAALDTISSEAQSILDELRRLAAGIRPAILTDAGLGPALRSLAERSPLPVTVECGVDRRLGDAVEAAAYFAASEALANAAKHARAQTVRISAQVVEGHLELSVSDDGAGGATTTGGTGLRGLADRVLALRGRIDVISPPGAGTEVRISLPCA